MVELSRYNASDEQAGISHGVLKNKLGYTKQKDLDDAETILQADAYEHFLDLSHTSKFTFNIKFLFEIHRYFFQPLYTWAGSVRTVDISKGEMLFAPVRYLSASVEELDRIMRDNTVQSSDRKADIAKKLALIHNEFNVVHPFRDGNGRTIRLCIDIILYTLDFEPMHYDNREEYLAACVAGALQQNESMQKYIHARLRKRKS